MREIRAKTTKKENREHAFNNVWVEGDLVVSRDKYYIHPRANAFQVNNELSKLIVLHEVIPKTIGQFTGLTDKNGKKIFEGDIVKAIQTEYNEDKEKEPIVFEFIGEMIFEDGCFGLRAKHIVDFYAPMWEEDDVKLEVIGNIYDNPELLEVE